MVEQVGWSCTRSLFCIPVPAHAGHRAEKQPGLAPSGSRHPSCSCPAGMGNQRLGHRGEGSIPRAGISCPELKHSSHGPVIPIYLPAGRWMLLVEFLPSCDQAYRAFAKLLQKIHALCPWDSKGKEGCGGEDKHRDKGAGRRKTSGDVPRLALKSQQHGRVQ